MSISVPKTRSGKPPSNYKEVLYWKISEKESRIFILNLLSIPLTFVFGIGFFIFVQTTGKAPNFIFGNLKRDLVLIFGILITIVLHEFAHGFAMNVFGAQAKYGFIRKGLMLYATANGYAFQRNQYIVISLAPVNDN